MLCHFSRGIPVFTGDDSKTLVLCRGGNRKFRAHFWYYFSWWRNPLIIPKGITCSTIQSFGKYRQVFLAFTWHSCFVNYSQQICMWSWNQTFLPVSIMCLHLFLASLPASSPVKLARPECLPQRAKPLISIDTETAWSIWQRSCIKCWE